MMMPGPQDNSTEEQDLLSPRKYVHMSSLSFISINGPLIVLSLMANVFFLFCLMTRGTQRVQQPLKILLGFLVCSTITYLFAVTCMYFLLVWIESMRVVNMFLWFVELMMNVNMTSYVWLMFYYYIMIVPSQRVLFLWVKKNIKPVIYVLLLFDRMIFLINSSYQMASDLDDSNSSNRTYLVVEELEIAVFSITTAYILLCLCIMMFSSFATAHYLNKHMKSLAASGGSLFNPRLRRHIRVTVTGILQGLLYLLYDMWFMVTVLSSYFPPYLFFDFYISFTVTSLYISITTVNLGVGQTLFRERAVHVWKAATQCLSPGKTLKDGRPAGSNSTTLATIESTGVDASL